VRFLSLASVSTHIVTVDTHVAAAAQLLDFAMTATVEQPRPLKAKLRTNLAAPTKRAGARKGSKSGSGPRFHRGEVSSDNDETSPDTLRCHSH
jgi:hypothetical protein